MYLFIPFHFDVHHCCSLWWHKRLFMCACFELVCVCMCVGAYVYAYMCGVYCVSLYVCVCICTCMHSILHTYVYLYLLSILLLIFLPSVRMFHSFVKLIMIMSNAQLYYHWQLFKNWQIYLVIYLLYLFWCTWPLLSIMTK